MFSHSDTLVLAVLLCCNAVACMLEVGRQVTCRCPSIVGWSSYLQWLWSTDVWTLATRYVLCYTYCIVLCTYPYFEDEALEGVFLNRCINWSRMLFL